MVNARFGGRAVPYGPRVVAPELMVMAIILFMGAEPAGRPAAESATSVGSQRLLPGAAPSRDDRPGIQVPEGGQDLDSQTYLRHI